MRVDDYFTIDDPLGYEGGHRSLDMGRLRQLRGGPIEGVDDVESAVPLARLVHDELETYGTSGGPELTNEGIREAILALKATVDRIGIDDFDPPFRDYSTFQNYWMRAGARIQ